MPNTSIKDTLRLLCDVVDGKGGIPWYTEIKVPFVYLFAFFSDIEYIYGLQNIFYSIFLLAPAPLAFLLLYVHSQNNQS